MNSDQLSQFYDWLKPLAKKDGLLFDLHGYNQTKNQISFEKKDLTTSCSQSQHINLRVLQNNKAGNSYTKDFSKQSLVDCYQSAKNSLQITDNSKAGELSTHQNYLSKPELYNSDLQKLNLNQKVQKTTEILDACSTYDKKIQPVNVAIADQNSLSFFVNSEAFQFLFKKSDVFFACYCLAIDKEKRSSAFLSKHCKNYLQIPTKKTGTTTAQLALKKLNFSIPATKKYPVIFKSGQVLAALLDRLVQHMSGKNIYEGMSLFKGSLNKELFSKNLTLYEDPLVDWGAKSQIFDGEGFASEKTVLVEDGVLKNYLTSSFYAKELKVPHTKNAFWQEDNGTLNVSATQIVMQEGDSSFKDLLSEFPQVIVIDYLKGLAGYNAVSGDFSIESEGFLHEKGDNKALCQFLVSGNIAQIFANIIKIANDSEINDGTIKAPSFLVADLMISGK